MAVASDPEVPAYFHAHVVGGQGAFVAELAAPNEAAAIMLEKLKRDLLIASSATDPLHRLGW